MNKNYCTKRQCNMGYGLNDCDSRKYSPIYVCLSLQMYIILYSANAESVFVAGVRWSKKINKDSKSKKWNWSPLLLSIDIIGAVLHCNIVISNIL